MSIQVQFGCGGNKLPDFINHDIEVNIEGPLPYETASVDFILIEHCLEHTDTHHALGFLDEAHRILKPGGCLRICVPVLDWMDDRAAARDLIVNHGHQQVCAWESLVGMLFAAGFDRKNVQRTGRKEIDGHWRVIGKDKDQKETLRVEAVK